MGRTFAPLKNLSVLFVRAYSHLHHLPQSARSLWVAKFSGLRGTAKGALANNLKKKGALAN
jgi:hypothetical protein